MGLSAPMAVELVEDISELGLRMGFCFLWAGFGSLIGGPINGALLTGNFIWWRPAVFSGVCVLFHCIIRLFILLVLDHNDDRNLCFPRHFLPISKAEY